MADPLAGLKILTTCLKPNGLMKIGLYSELARQSVVKARSLIERDSVPHDMTGMLKLRRKIMKLNDPAFKVFQQANDFYSTSELRDLLFHVQEHRFVIPEIAEALDELGLTFIGFEFSDISTIRNFEQAHPKKEALYNLAIWHEYEQLNPYLFLGMYLFWVQKR